MYMPKKIQESRFRISADELDYISMRQTPHIDSVSIDYKEKVFQLMKKNTDQQLLITKQQQTVKTLKITLNNLKSEIGKFFDTLGISSFEEVQKKFAFFMRQKQRNSDSFLYESNCRSSIADRSYTELQFNKIVKEYQNIIKTQHKKLQNKTKKYREREHHLNCERKIAQDKYDLQVQNMKQKEKMRKQKQAEYEKLSNNMSEIRQQKLQLQDQLKEKQKEIESQKEMIEGMKKQIQEFMTQNHSLFEQKKQIQQKNQNDIMHFEEMQNLVEKKLIQVQYEMSYYKRERKEHLQKISVLKNQLKEYKQKEEERYYSFGENENEQATQTEMQQQTQQRVWDACFEESIKTLLQQNNRLKNALLSLFKEGKYDKIPENVDLELKILLSTSVDTFEEEKFSETDLQTQ